MITYIDVLDAVNTLNGWRPNDWNSSLAKQLALSLRVYKDRGEFDGTIKSACECLAMAEYEVEHLIQRSGAR